MTTGPGSDEGKVRWTRGIAPFLIGLTWAGQPPRRIHDPDRGRDPTPVGEAVVAVTVTLVAVVIAGWVGWRWTGSWTGAVLGVVGGLFVASLVLQLGLAVVRLSRRARR